MGSEYCSDSGTSTGLDKTGKRRLSKIIGPIEWATELNLHVIIDWHSIGNLQTEMYQSDIYDTTLKQTYDFWRTIAAPNNSAFSDVNISSLTDAELENVLLNHVLSTVTPDFTPTMPQDI